MSIEKIKDLKKLLDEGAITQSEFDAEKSKILNSTSSENSSGMSISNIQNVAGIASILFFVSMFMPWFDFFFTASGWQVANIADKTTPVVYLVYLIPVGALLSIKSLMNKDPIPGFARLIGLIPTLLLVGMLFKLMNAGVGGTVIEQLLNVIGIGFWLSFSCGWVLVTSSQNK